MYSCAEKPKSQEGNLHDEMISLMNSLLDAASELDAEKVIDLCLESSEFLYVGDGVVMDYNKFVDAERTAFPNYVTHEIKWDTLFIKVLSMDVVAALAPFHQKLIHKDGTIYQFAGEVSWIATKTDQGLKLIYGHARHQADSTLIGK